MPYRPPGCKKYGELDEMADGKPTLPGVEIKGGWGDRYDEVLTPASLAFIAGLQRKFNP